MALHNKVLSNNTEFNSILNSLVVPLRFSFMALVTARKATIFSEDLLTLMKYVLNYKYEDNGKLVC